MANGELPREWERSRIRDRYRFTSKPRDLRLSKYPQVAFLPMDAIPTGRLFIREYLERVPGQISSGTYFEEGDLLLSKITPCFENGKQAIAQETPNGFGIATTEVIPLKAVAGISDISFLAYYLLDQEVRAGLASKMEGATGRQRLPKSVLEEWEMPFPPLPEQQTIAAVLSKLQRAVEAQDKIIATLKELKAATLAKLFREGLRGEPLKETEIGEIPESWNVVTLGKIASIERGKFSHRPRNDPRYYGGIIPFVQTGDVAKSGGRIRTYSQTLNEKGLSVSRIFPSGTILLTIAANIADTGILEFDSAFPDSIVGIMPEEGVSPVFLEAYLQTQKAEMDRLAPKGTQKNITLQFLRPWLVPIPPADEQEAIAKSLRTIDDAVEANNRKREVLSGTFGSMLHLLMTGELRLPNVQSQEWKGQ